VDPNVISYDELFISESGDIDIVMESVDNESVATLLKKNVVLNVSFISSFIQSNELILLFKFRAS